MNIFKTIGRNYKRNLAQNISIIIVLFISSLSIAFLQYLSSYYFHHIKEGKDITIVRTILMKYNSDDELEYVQSF